MKTLLIGALAAAAAAIVSIAPANAFYYGPGFAPEEVIPARVVCNAWGQCWQTRPRYVVPPPIGFYPGYRPYRPYSYRPYGWHRPHRHW